MAALVAVSFHPACSWLAQGAGQCEHRALTDLRRQQQQFRLLAEAMHPWVFAVPGLRAGLAALLVQTAGFRAGVQVEEARATQQQQLTPEQAEQGAVALSS